MSIVPFELKSIDLVADWNYNCLENTCKCCNISLYSFPIVRNLTNFNVSRYECSHAFHEKCIKKMLKKYKCCPVCNTENFKFDTNLNMKSNIKLFKKN
jgi:hypothetical protein